LTAWYLYIFYLNTIPNVECADGQLLPYIGYIEVSLSACGLSVESSIYCPLLVVPDSLYNKNVPVLLGINILSKVLDLSKELH